MVDAFSTDEGEETNGKKDNFIGRVVTSDVVSDEYPVKDEYREDDETYIDHLYEIEVLSEDWDNMSEFSIKLSSSYTSKWMVLLHHLEQFLGNLREEGIDSPQDLCEYLEGRVFEFKDISWEEDEEIDFGEGSPTYKLSEMFEGNDNSPNNFMVPVREVTDEDELADLGGEVGKDGDDADVVELE